jgi:RNA polymerase sigma factor (sigma-70 family)
MPPQATEATTGPKRKGNTPRAPLRGPEERNTIVLANLGLAHKFPFDRGRRYCKHMDMDDAVQACVLGLIRAAELFDPGLGYRFTTYAFAYMRSTLQAAADRDRAVPTPRHCRNTYGRQFAAEVARTVKPPVRLDEGWERGQTLGETVLVEPGRSARAEAEDREERARFRRAVARLSPALRDAAEGLARGEQLIDGARRLGVSRERVRQLRELALRQLRADLAPDWRAP